MINKSLFQTALLVIFGGALVVAVLIFAGILPGFRSQSTSQNRKLEVWGTFSSVDYGRVIDALNQDYSKEFNVTYFDQGDGLETKLINALASGQGPDVIIAPHELIIKHRDKFIPLPFASLPLRSYQEIFIDQGSLFVLSDGLTALPLVIDPLLFYYNKDLYKNANIVTPPANWEEFVKIQPLLTRVGESNRLIQSAFALGAFDNNFRAKDILSLLILQAGGQPAVFANNRIVVSLNDNFGFTLKPAEAALNFFLQFADPAKSTYSWNRSLPEARDSFTDERLASYFGLASELPYLREKNPHLNFEIDLVPQMTILSTDSRSVSQSNRMTFGRLYGVAVLKSSPRSNIAWPMVFALTGEKFSRQSALALNLAPTRRTLLRPDPASPDQKVIFDSALISRAWFDFAPTEITAIFRELNDNVSTGRLTAESAIGQATDQIKRLISN